MTLERAVEILNERRHEAEGWKPNVFVNGKPNEPWHVWAGLACGPDRYQSFSEFEAIAVAEKYERGGK